MICLQLVYCLKKSIGGCSALSSNGRMVGFDHCDEILMVSATVCTIIHWTRPMVSHDERLSSCHDFTKLLCCILSQP